MTTEVRFEKATREPATEPVQRKRIKGVRGIEVDAWIDADGDQVWLVGT